MTTPLRAAISGLICCAALVAARPARALPLELSAEGVVTFVNDHETKGGGFGPAVGLGVQFGRDLLTRGSTFAFVGRTSALLGAGVAYTFELGAEWRQKVGQFWEPNIELDCLYLGGDLVRTIHGDGQLARDAVALQVGIGPARFQLDQGWISLFTLRAGSTFRNGSPPLAASLVLVQLGHSF